MPPKDPKGPQDKGNLEFEVEMIDVDVVNVELLEPVDVQSRLEHALYFGSFAHIRPEIWRLEMIYYPPHSRGPLFRSPASKVFLESPYQ